MLGVLLSSLLAGMVAQGPAAPPPIAPAPVSTPDARTLTKARTLTELMNPPDLMLQSNMKGWEAGIANTWKQDPAAVKLEAAYPGVTKAAIDAARPVGRRSFVAMVEKSIDMKARIVAERLSDAELDAATQVFNKPFWTRFVTRILTNMDPDPLAREAATAAIEDGKPTVSKDAMDKMMVNAGRLTANSISAEDQIEMMRFERTSFAPKLSRIGEEVDGVLLQWANNPDPAFVAEQQQAIQDAIIAFVDARTK